MSAAPKRAPACPVCGAPAVPEEAPFCGSRCRLVDLHRWLAGAYLIPGRPEDDDGD